jgi:hypothetical protein
VTRPSERLARIAADAARALAGLAFGFVARVRGDRALHPDGRVFAGTFISAHSSATAASPFFADRRERAALVRLSRGGGLPERLPDVRGCALRVVDAHGPGRHQDLLLASSLPQALGRHLLLPGHDFGGAFYSSLLPYRIGGRRLLFGAVLTGPAGRSLDEVEGSVAGGGVHIRMLAAAPLGTWMEVARATLDRRAPEADDLRFNPWVTGGGIEPIGALMSLRDPAYRASQAAADGSRFRRARPGPPRRPA